MESCPSGQLSWWELTWWGVVLVGSRPSGELSWWGVVLVGSCPSGELSWWGVVLVESCPGGELYWWELTWWGVMPYFGKRKQVTKVPFLVKEQNVSVICTDVNGIS